MYYCYLTDEQLTTVLPNEIKQYMGYERDYLLNEVIFGTPEQLEDGRWLCCCGLRNKKYIENNCIEKEPTEAELDMWRQYVGSDNVFTLENE